MNFSLPGGFAHSQSVLCLDVNKENTIIATGSVDSTVKLTHVSNGKVFKLFVIN